MKVSTMNLIFYYNLLWSVLDINLVCVSGVGSSMIKNASNVEKVPLETILVEKNVCKVTLSLINKLLVFNPNKRLTAEKALEHSYVSTFHDPEQEIVLNQDIVIPFKDDIRLSVEDYRNKLYEIMSTHHHLRKTPKSQSDSSGKSNRTLGRVAQQTKAQSEARISYDRKNNSFVNIIKSDSKVVAKQNIQFPKTINGKLPLNDVRTINGARRRFSNEKNYSPLTNYSQSHGVVSQSTLMGLKATGMR